MARIPAAELERLKNEVSVQRLVESTGIELKKSGKDLTGRCPFHADDTASLVVTPAKNLWHCFGCGAAGGPIDWMMKQNGISFRHAVELLREGEVIPSLAAGSQPVKRRTVKVLDAPLDFDADEQALLNQVVDYYHATLRHAPEALIYLESRGLVGDDAQEAIVTFKIGYANRTLGLRLPEKNRQAGADIRTRLQRLGIYRESGHEHFNGSLIVPVLDETGQVKEVYGRKLLDNLRQGTPKHLYLPGPHRGVWNVQALAAHSEIILCEALIDALTFWCEGYRNVTSSYGTEGFTDDHLAAFRRYGTRRVLIAYDRDEAGERGAAKVAEQLMASGIECYRILFPKGMDANAYALKVKPADKALGVVIRKAVWLGKGNPNPNPNPPEADGGKPAQPSATVTDVTTTTPKTPLPSPQKASEPSKPSLAAVASKPVNAPVPASMSAPTPTPEPATPPATPESTPEPLPASPMPTTAPDIPVEVKGNEILLTLGEGKDSRHYRVRGLAKNLSVDVLKINLLVRCGVSGGGADANGAFHLDTLDLYSAKQRGHYVAQAAQETGLDERLLKRDIGRVLLTLEQLQDKTITAVLQPEPQPQMDDAERQAALDWLKSPDLAARILADFAACGLIGEDTNKLVGFLAAVSRKLDRPLGIVIQSSSAAGKTTLMDAVLDFVPDEEKVKYSAMTGQSLYYMGGTNLKHKALAIVEEEGASRASYALKLLQSEGELTIASTGKDPETGNLITQDYRVEGPVALLLTTTARDLDEELMNRCLVLSVDEGREQTRAIHRLQRDKRTLEGLLAKHHKAALIKLHQNAQRLLRPLDVLNPYARFLTFPDQTTRLRRDHDKYLTLIDTIAFLHQHQRPVKQANPSQAVSGRNAVADDTPDAETPNADAANAETPNVDTPRGNAPSAETSRAERRPLEYIEVELTDIALANRIAHDVLGRSLDDLPPQTRRLLQLIDPFVTGECQRQDIPRADVRFSRRTLREALAWGDTQLKVHLARLAELEYLVVHRTKTNGFEYELVYDNVAEGDSVRFPGLADIDALAQAYDAARSGPNSKRSATGRRAVGPRSAGSRNGEKPAKPDAAQVAVDSTDECGETQSTQPKKAVASSSYPPRPVYTQVDIPFAAAGN